MKYFNIIVAIVVVALSAARAVYLAGCSKRAIQNVTVQLLRQIPRSYLVLESAEELTVATIDGGSILWGPRRGMASAVRRTHWGCDLARIRHEDIAVSGQEVHVKLPDPSVFDSAIDLGTFRYLTQRTGFQALADAICGRSLMRELAEIACRTPPKFTPEEIQAKRAVFVHRLNSQASGLFEAKGLTVRFR